MIEQPTYRSLGPARTDEADVVFDFAGMGHTDLDTLCLVLTARLIVGLDERSVWIHGATEHTWRYLEAMGLEAYFKDLPGGAGLVH